MYIYYSYLQPLLISHLSSHLIPTIHAHLVSYMDLEPELVVRPIGLHGT